MHPRLAASTRATYKGASVPLARNSDQGRSATELTRRVTGHGRDYAGCSEQGESAIPKIKIIKIGTACASRLSLLKTEIAT